MSNYKHIDIHEGQNYVVAGTISFVPESEYKKILDENIELKKQINQYYDNERILRETIRINDLTIEELKKENEMLKNELLQLKLKLQEQSEIIKEQTEIIKEQNIKITNLDKTVQEQSEIIKEQKIKITNLEKDVKELKERDTPITIREAMSILETHMMVDLVGSKRQANRYYGINDLSERDNYKLIYNKYLKSNGISQEHIDLILELKKEGNKYAHSNRPTYNKDEWKDMLINSLDDPNNQQDIKMIEDILVLMEKYNPLSDPWIMNKP